jgi:hypothetical protein
MKKLFTLCLFAVSLYAQGQSVINEPAAFIQPEWIKTFSAEGMGYLDSDGEVVLNPVYEELHAFGELTAELAVIVQDGFSGLIDLNGNIIAEPKYSTITKADDFNPNWLMVSIGGEYGFIDMDGNVVVPIAYDEFVAPAEETATLRPGVIKFHPVKKE